MRRTKRSRKYSLGGSDTAAVLGLNPYQSLFDAWWAKVGDSEDKFSENKYTYWGKIKEKVVAEHYALRHSVTLIESPKRVRDERLWMTGTPDRLILAPDNWEGRKDMDYLHTYDDPVSGKLLIARGLEIKTALEKHTDKWNVRGAVSIGDRPSMTIRNYGEANGSVPLYYWVQCQVYMNLMQFPEWDLCVLIGSSDYREYRLHYDEDFMHAAVADCEKFWKYNVEGKNEPPVDWGKMVNSYLARKYGDSVIPEIREGDVLDNSMAKSLKTVGGRMKELIEEEKALREELNALTEKHRAVKEELDYVKKDNDTMCNWFRDRIGRDEGVRTLSGVITWKGQKDGTRVLRKNWNK